MQAKWSINGVSWVRILVKIVALAAELTGEPATPAPPPSEQQTRAAHGLTSREVEVLRLLVEGRPDREIGEALSISHRTVERHVAGILAKLGAENRTAATNVAIRLGLV